jgi:hypothetical protein
MKMEREKMDDLWDSVYYTPDMELKIKDMAPGLVEFLMASLLHEEEIDIGTFNDENGSNGTNVCYDVYNTDKMLQVRYKNDTNFELFVALENDDEGCLEFFHHTLTDNEVAIIPEGLQILMKKAFDSGDGLVWRPKTIDKS